VGDLDEVKRYDLTPIVILFNDIVAVFECFLDKAELVHNGLRFDIFAVPRIDTVHHESQFPL
jgi:hypothetical protein